ncbi:MAG: phosphate starvation-inducible protein PhoH, partial [Flavobacteriaceae bacterium]
MNELIIELTDISAQDFFGMNNETITSLKNYFPKLKIVARGNKVKAFGDEAVLDEFEKRFDLLTSHFARYNRLDENSLERILTSDDSEVTALK